MNETISLSHYPVLSDVKSVHVKVYKCIEFNYDRLYSYTPPNQQDDCCNPIHYRTKQ